MAQPTLIYPQFASFLGLVVEAITVVSLQPGKEIYAPPQ